MLGFGGGGGGVDRDICWPNIKLNRVLAIADWTSFRFLYVVCDRKGCVKFEEKKQKFKYLPFVLQTDQRWVAEWRKCVGSSIDAVSSLP